MERAGASEPPWAKTEMVMPVYGALQVVCLLSYPCIGEGLLAASLKISIMLNQSVA